MKPIGTPVRKLTAGCIWNSFRSSGKEELELTGGQAAERLALEGALTRAGAVVKPGPQAFRVDLDAPFGQLGCVIMGSGLGRRFGSNKLMALLEGEPLIRYALDATEGIFARRVVVTRHREVAELARALGAETVLHGEPGRNDTVRLGMECLGEGLEGVLFCPGDQPLLEWETVASLALCAVCAPGNIWRASWQGKPGAPVLFPAWTFGELKDLPEGQGGGAVIRRYPDRVGLVPARSSWELADVDRPEDLEAMAAVLASSRQGKPCPRGPSGL